ncbi:MAG: VanW family protein, partial [Acidimicrobiia bacterium]|nr:VanW family protein [Acidimicrobiia bacterium]
PVALADVLAEWNLTAIDKPAFDGGVVIVDGVPAPEYPEPGTRIDAETATDLILSAAAGDLPSPVVLPLTDIVPRVTDAQVDAALAEARHMVTEPIVLEPGPSGASTTERMTFSPAALVTALRSEIRHNSPADVVTYLDTETLKSLARRTAPLFSVPPTPASFEFDDATKQISVLPHEIGAEVDIDAIPDAVLEALERDRTGVIPMKPGPPPDLTTDVAEAMGPFGEVSSFTTYHPCCQSRVVNIQLLADEIRGSWVLPGEQFSINETAGKRTLAEGYRRAGAIIGGEVVCCDSSVNSGGGTSQFATTLYNAVFFGCYEDVFHQPHSLYFSRYPFVREATLGYPAPDVVFRNDSPSVVYIDTTYTGTSITVTLYGNNGGRVCTSERSGNTVTRVMTHPDGSVTRESWTWNYRTEKKTTTTTTTRPPSSSTTTTTAPSDTTTTTTTTTTAPPDTTTTAPPDTTTTTP